MNNPKSTFEQEENYEAILLTVTHETYAFHQTFKRFLFRSSWFFEKFPYGSQHPTNTPSLFAQFLVTQFGGGV